MQAALEWVQMTTPGMQKPEEPKPMGEFIEAIMGDPNTRQVTHGESQ